MAETLVRKLRPRVLHEPIIAWILHRVITLLFVINLILTVLTRVLLFVIDSH